MIKNVRILILFIIIIVLITGAIEGTKITGNVEENATIAIRTQAEEITSIFDANAFNGWHLKNTLNLQNNMQYL